MKTTPAQKVTICLVVGIVAALIVGYLLLPTKERHRETSTDGIEAFKPLSVPCINNGDCSDPRIPEDAICADLEQHLLVCDKNKRFVIIE